MQAQIERAIIDCVVNGAGLPTGSTQTDVRAPVLADSTQTVSGTMTFSGSNTTDVDLQGILVTFTEVI